MHYLVSNNPKFLRCGGGTAGTEIEKGDVEIVANLFQITRFGFPFFAGGVVKEVHLCMPPAMVEAPRYSGVSWRLAATFAFMTVKDARCLPTSTSRRTSASGRKLHVIWSRRGKLPWTRLLRIFSRWACVQSTSSSFVSSCAWLQLRETVIIVTIWCIFLCSPSWFSNSSRFFSAAVSRWEIWLKETKSWCCLQTSTTMAMGRWAKADFCMMSEV